MMKIRAYAITKSGGPAERFQYEKALGSHEVLVKITHRSLARGDIQYIDNHWSDTQFPLVPGHEIVGIIEDVGSDVADLRAGDRVGIGYQQEACFQCSYCTEGIEQLCAKQKVIAVDRYGGLAEHIIVDGRFAFRLMPQLDSATSTPLLSSGLTVYSAIVRAPIPPASRVAVLGAGGLGHLAIQFLGKLGHRVTAFSHSPHKRTLVERLGAIFVDTSDRAFQIDRNGEFEFIISTLTITFDLDAFVRMLTPRGQLCLVASPLERFSLSGGLLNNSRKSIYGNYIGSRFETVQMLEFAATHGIAAVVDVMPVSRANEAIRKIRNREVQTSLVLENVPRGFD